MTTLKFSSQGDWTVKDFHVFLQKLNVLYNKLYVINKLCETRPVVFQDSKKLRNILKNSVSYVPEERTLSVDYIQIHSPGKFKFKVGASAEFESNLRVKANANINIDTGKSIKKILKIINILHENFDMGKVLNYIRSVLNKIDSDEAREILLEIITDAIKKLSDAGHKNKVEFLDEDEDE